MISAAEIGSKQNMSSSPHAPPPIAAVVFGNDPLPPKMLLRPPPLWISTSRDWWWHLPIVIIAVRWYMMMVVSASFRKLWPYLMRHRYYIRLGNCHSNFSSSTMDRYLSCRYICRAVIPLFFSLLAVQLVPPFCSITYSVAFGRRFPISTGRQRHPSSSTSPSIRKWPSKKFPQFSISWPSVLYLVISCHFCWCLLRLVSDRWSTSLSTII